MSEGSEMAQSHAIVDEHGNYTEVQTKHTFGEAFWLYVKDANKLHLLGVGRVLLLILAGYAPFAALNDVLTPFTFGLPVLDDLEIPIGVLAAIRILFEVNRYRTPGYSTGRKR